MSLRNVKTGDLVRVDGRLAEVKGRELRKVQIEFCHGSRAFVSVTARQVEAHWSRRA